MYALRQHKLGENMKIKLKKDAPLLESHSSHQGFPTSEWSKLNAGQTIEVDKIPDVCKDKIETVSSSSSSSSTSSSSSSSSQSSGGK